MERKHVTKKECLKLSQAQAHGMWQNKNKLCVHMKRSNLRKSAISKNGLKIRAVINSKLWTAMSKHVFVCFVLAQTSCSPSPFRSLHNVQRNKTNKIVSKLKWNKINCFLRGLLSVRIVVIFRCFNRFKARNTAKICMCCSKFKI